jgi:hypothetical protein
MTAGAMSAARPRRPALGGLLWVTWRQHRSAVVSIGVAFGALAIYLVISGVQMHGAESTLGLNSCGSLVGPHCQAALSVFEQQYQGAAMYLPRFIEFVPALIGAFVGGPLVARELETGIYRFAWTQEHNRAQWLLTKLGLVAAILVAMGLALSAVFSWWFTPWEPIMGRLADGEAYEITGVVFAARILFGLCLGAAAGAVVRRTVPAMLVTVMGWVAVAFPSVIYLRPLIEKPLSVPSASNSVAANAWALHNWYQNAAGQHLSSRGFDHLLALARVQGVVTDRAFQRFLSAGGGRHGPATSPTTASGTSRSSKGWATSSFLWPWPASPCGGCGAELADRQASRPVGPRPGRPRPTGGAVGTVSSEST